MSHVLCRCIAAAALWPRSLPPAIALFPPKYAISPNSIRGRRSCFTSTRAYNVVNCRWGMRLYCRGSSRVLLCYCAVVIERLSDRVLVRRWHGHDVCSLVTAGAQGAELPHCKKAQPSLLYSLANCSLLCALPGCCERSCVVSGKKLLLCASCRWKRQRLRDGCWMHLFKILRVRSGLARYCCPDHQRLHWQVLLLLVPPPLQLRSLQMVAQCSLLFRRTSPRAIDGGAQKGGCRVNLTTED